VELMIAGIGKRDARKRGMGTFSSSVNRRGRYGTIKYMNAHKFAYTVPYGLIIRHKCDNPPCCNPNHMILGTVADNTADAIDRGLWNPHDGWLKSADKMRAAQIERRAFNECDIAVMIIDRANGMSWPEIARNRNLSEGAVLGVAQGSIYQDLPLARWLGDLYKSGVRFPRPYRYTARRCDDPQLLELVRSAHRLIVRYNEAAQRKAAAARALQDVNELFN
jgi:hypothetical protein